MLLVLLQRMSQRVLPWRKPWRSSRKTLESGLPRRPPLTDCNHCSRKHFTSIISPSGNPNIDIISPAILTSSMLLPSVVLLLTFSIASICRNSSERREVEHPRRQPRPRSVARSPLRVTTRRPQRNAGRLPTRQLLRTTTMTTRTSSSSSSPRRSKCLCYILFSMLTNITHSEDDGI